MKSTKTPPGAPYVLTAVAVVVPLLALSLAHRVGGDWRVYTLAGVLLPVGLLWARLLIVHRRLNAALSHCLPGKAQIEKALAQAEEARRLTEEALAWHKESNANLEKQLAAGSSELQRTETSLNEYRIALEASDEMVAVIDRDFALKMVNSAFLKQHGFEGRHLVGRHIQDALGAEAFQAVRPHLNVCFLGEIVEYERPGAVDGPVVGHQLVRYYPVRLKGPKVDRVVIVTKDLTAVRKAEEDRQRVFSLSLDPICVAGFDGYFKDVNDAWSRILGWSKDDLLGVPWLSFVHPQDAPAMSAAVERLAQGESLRDFRNRYVCKDGGVRWLEWNAVSAVDEGLIYAVVRDITSQIKAEEAIKLNQERLASLLKLSQMTDASDEAIRTFALEEVVRLTRSNAGYLHFVHEDLGTIDLVAWSEGVQKVCQAEKAKHYPVAQAGVWADCIRRRRPVIHNDYQSLPDKRGYPEGHFHLTRHMSVPVVDSGKIVAVAGVGNKETPYDATDVDQLALYMKSMWSILKEKRARQILKQYSMEDGLTGLANRRRLDETLQREWQRAQRAGQPLALILVDIDFFKAFNDHYGHQSGDECLKKVASVLQGVVRRGGDLVARYGGEEFVTILPDTDLAGAREVAESMRRGVYDLNLAHANSAAAPRITISAGVAAWVPDQSARTDLLLGAADRALYDAKRAGRNRVCGRAAEDTDPLTAETCSAAVGA